jgi:hypothetical protein
VRSARGLALLACAALVGCAAGLRSTPGTRYQGMMLNARAFGAEQLDTEMKRDPKLREYVQREGQPDYIYFANPNHVELVYYRASKLVHFRRDPAGGETTVTDVTPLPTPLVNVLEVDLRAGTPGPFDPEAPLTNCWSVDTADGRCRTCCVGPVRCSMSCDKG